MDGNSNSNSNKKKETGGIGGERAALTSASW